MDEKDKKTGTQDAAATVGAVMVVGGGIAGMQASLDLANSGFKVYLVEQGPAIGGRMSQLDKTFPTNDCAMCMISPKLVEVDKHLNIEIITQAQLLSLEGEAGNFTARVLKKPRYVDLDKCNACGDCEAVCPVRLADEFDESLDSRKAIFKRYPQAIPSAYLISKAERPPCKLTCPAGCNGQGYVALISQGKYVEALEHIKNWIPLPGSLGRICHHPCEAECNRGDIDQPVGIAPLKRFAADYVRELRKAGKAPAEQKPVIDPAKPKVAVVGAGPAGLACAVDLVRLGYPVTILDANPKPGGMLYSAIPRYRLPKDALAEDIQELLDMGIELKSDTVVGKDVTLDGLKSQGYRAVFIAIGVQKSRSLPIPGVELPQVVLALDFLRDANFDRPVNLGKRVVVIGGGNVAIDVARTAVRLGAVEVHLACLESPVEMPAHHWEVEEAVEEGVKVHTCWGPKQVLSSEGKVTGMELVKCTAVFDAEKRFSPVFDDKTITRLDCDSVIIAIGQATDLGLLKPESKVKSGRGGLLAVDPVTLATGEPGIFAGGDCVSGPKSAVEAIAQGHEAAISIDRYVRGADLAAGREKAKQDAAPVPAGKHAQRQRTVAARIPLERRTTSFEEMDAVYSEEQALAEAQRCLNCGLCSECLQCVKACGARAAIDHSMKEEAVDIQVGSVILAPGLESIDPALKGEYGYGRMPNVVTAFEFERILSASGPYQGVIQRPSDSRHPHKVAWIQCVGSRDVSCGKDYCSSVCCMYATKEAIIAKEHAHEIEPTIFYNDMRAHGKGFDRYYESARDKFGVRYVKSIVSTVKELQQSHDLRIDYMDEQGQKRQEDFDLVVLSVGIQPSATARELAQRTGIDLDRFGFCSTEEFQPNRTSRPGVFVAGAFEAPMDIPESVMTASSAACLAAETIAAARGSLVTEKCYPPEAPLNGAAPRVGVFVCRCGSNIARVVNVPGVAEYARTLPYVAHAEENLYTCSTDTQRKIVDAIKTHGLNRVVVASCSPRTHEPLFQDTIREAGLNKYLFEMANIRDQCSWVHGSHPKEATEKAKDLVRMAVARSATLEPLYETPIPVTRRGLIIGGGLAGMVAALEMASQGFESVLIEREKELGGNLRHLQYTLEGSDPQELLASLVQRLRLTDLVTVYTGAELEEFSGHVGNYKATVRLDGGEKREIEHGVVIVATGGTEYRPTEHLYGKSGRVLSQTELEQRIAGKDGGLDGVGSVVMVQCVGSREPEHMYCSRICCSEAVKNAIKLKELDPERSVYVLYRDIRTYGFKEIKYREAREKGVVFIRFDEQRKPEVTEDERGLKVKVFDTALGMELELRPDLAVLSAAVRPQADAAAFARIMKLPLTQDGFLMEAHMKLRPLDFTNDGMYLCGLAHSPKFISETISQAQGVVSRAATILSQPHLMVGGVVAVVDGERCAACLTCVRECPFRVPHISQEGVAEIEAAACQGCGVCASVCPRKAISLQNYKDEQVLAKCAALY